jgi:hypothetical protein
MKKKKKEKSKIQPEWLKPVRNLRRLRLGGFW